MNSQHVYITRRISWILEVYEYMDILSIYTEISNDLGQLGQLSLTTLEMYY
jgi:hypothetical protein